MFCNATDRSTEYTVQAACFVRNGPPSLKFQYFSTLPLYVSLLSASTYFHIQSIGYVCTLLCIVRTVPQFQGLCHCATKCSADPVLSSFAQGGQTTSPMEDYSPDGPKYEYQWSDTKSYGGLLSRWSHVRVPVARHQVLWRTTLQVVPRTSTSGQTTSPMEDYSPGGPT